MLAPTILNPLEHARFNHEKMSKVTLFESPRVLVGLNCFEPGQEHALHTHAGMDKIYHVLSGRGEFLQEHGATPMRPGAMLAAAADVPHGIRNSGDERLVVLAFLTPAPKAKGH
ncbi:MAG: cupin domain-containing protein [Planctomycetota bacterium]